MRSVDRFLTTLVVLAVIAGSLCAEPPVPTQPAVVLVFDASGSMLEKIEGRPRMDIAREAIHSMLATWDPAVPIGLVAYGHRKRGDCADIEVLVAPGPLDKPAFARAIGSLKPQGMTPLADAVITASKILAAGPKGGSIVLLTDGAETCKQDPCRAAAEIAARGVDLKVHVVGFDLSSRELQSVECLTVATGGTLLAANDLPSLVDSMRIAAQTVAAPVEAPKPAAMGKLALRTLATEGSKPLEAFYKIRALDAENPMPQRSSSRTQHELPPGRYHVEAQWGRASVAAELTVSSGKETSHTFVLGAGILVPTAVAGEGGEALGNVLFRVYSADTSLEGGREQVASGPREFKLTAGRYILAGEWGMARAEMEVEVKANEAVRPVLIMNAGFIQASAIPREGDEPLEAVLFRVRRAKGGLEGGQTELGANAKGEFRVNAGVYTVAVEWGAAKTSVEVEVKPNDRVEPVLNLNAGILRVGLVDANNAPVSGLVRVHRRSGLESRLREVTNGRSGSDFRLSAGSYEVTAEIAGAKGSATVSVAAGERTEVSVTLTK